MKLFISFIIFIAIVSCEQKQPEKHKSKHANHHMNKNSFDELLARFEDSSRVEWQKPSVVINKLGDITGKTIADLGAGTGYFSFRLSKKGANVLALDADDRFLSYIENRKKELNDSLIETRKVPYESPLLSDSEVDILFTVNTYHHIENRNEYFRKVLKGIKPGGNLYVVDFKKEEAPFGPPIEIKLSGLEVIKELQQVGFSKVIIDTYSLPYQYIISAKKAEKE